MPTYPQLSVIPELHQDFEAARNIYQTVRQTSDNIRAQIIPQLIRDRVPAREAYWALHRAECGPQPEIVAAWPVKWHLETYADADLEAIVPGKKREYDLFEETYWHVPHGNLPELEQHFFSAIEGMQVKGEVDFLRKLTAIHAGLLLAHFPQDLAGRTAEDFVVYLSEKYGYPLTISGNGYRGQMGSGFIDNVEAVQRAEWHFYPDIVYAVDRSEERYKVLNIDDRGRILGIGPLVRRASARIEKKGGGNDFAAAVALGLTMTASKLIEVIQGSKTAWKMASMILTTLEDLYSEHFESNRNLSYTTFFETEAEFLDRALALSSLEPIVDKKWKIRSKHYQHWLREVKKVSAFLKDRR